uniref:Uncharacterized protein n=1 Tax=Tetradesmus obliquus TaxID=3088 RepID=A0A383VXF6_TETOB
MLAQLCKQGAAKACRTEAAMSLLLASFNQGYPEGAERLLGMPGLGKGLTPGQVSSLLLAALQGPTTARKCISILLNVPAAQEMQWDSCEALLEAALMQHSTGAADVLPDLVGQLPLLARKMSFDQLQRTYQAAAQRYNDEALRLYVRLPVVRNASPAQLQQLMHLSLELCGAAFTEQQRSVSSNMAGFNTLCSFQQAQELSADMVEGLVEATFSVIKQAPAATPLLGKVWPLLCQLPQAQHIQPATILAWLGQCLSQERHQAAAALAVLLDQAAVLTAWGGLTRQEVEQLLARALPVAKRGSVQGVVCDLQRSAIAVHCSVVTEP